MPGDDDSKLTPDHVETNAVSIKIPHFWVHKPEMWFYQVEAQFQISGITSEETKFNYLIAQLEPRFVENFWDIVKNPTKEKYSAAKERLLNTFQESENKKIKRLITGLELGDEQPSQLLRKMRSLAGSEFSDKVLRTLWLEKMPDCVKSVLIVSDESLEKLATMADRIIEMSPRAADVAAGHFADEPLENIDDKIKFPTNSRCGRGIKLPVRFRT